MRLISNYQTLLVCDPINLFYFTGLELSAGQLVITNEGMDLYVDGRYLTVAEASGIPVHPQDELPKKTYVVDPTTLTLEQAEKLDIIPQPHLLAEMRAVKRPDELEALERAARLNKAGQDYVEGLLKPGITEREVSAKLQIFWLENGGTRPSFDPIIAFGPNSALPHHRPTDRPLEEGDFVLVDTGVEVDHYQSDATRAYADHEIYGIVQRAQEAALEAVKPGTLASEVDRAAREVIEAAGYTLPHNVGHGVGLEVHELPRIRKGNETPLQENMVLTVEPAIYLPGVGGVRLEETVRVTASSWQGLNGRARRREPSRDQRTPRSSHDRRW